MGCMMGFAIDTPASRMNKGGSNLTASARRSAHARSFARQRHLVQQLHQHRAFGCAARATARHRCDVHRVSAQIHDAARPGRTAPPRREDDRLPGRQRPDLLDQLHPALGAWRRAQYRRPRRGFSAFVRRCLAWGTAGAGRPPTRPTSSRRCWPGTKKARRPTASLPRRAAPATWAANRTRPLCPYPSTAHYRSGDPEPASSFVCQPGRA